MRLQSGELTRLGQGGDTRTLNRARKRFRNTEPYVHLTLRERQRAVREVAEVVSQWGFARLFAECIDTAYFDPARTSHTINEQAFEQLISRFEAYLRNVSHQRTNEGGAYGLVVHDNNDTVARRHTRMMRAFHQTGTLWTNVERIVETPMFVDSKLTRLVQVADLCAYALRRYVEKGETELFNPIFERADRKGEVAVGVRHYSPDSCSCRICLAHQP